MMDLYFKMVLSLLFVLVILGFIYLVIRKRVNLNNKGGLFDILEYKSFGPKMGIMAVKFGDRVLLIALTSTNITLIEHFDAKKVLKDENRDDELAQKIKKLRDGLNEPN